MQMKILWNFLKQVVMSQVKIVRQKVISQVVRKLKLRI